MVLHASFSQIFKAFMEAMKYTLFEATVIRLKFLRQFLFLKIWSGSEGDKKSTNQLQLVTIFKEF